MSPLVRLAAALVLAGALGCPAEPPPPPATPRATVTLTAVGDDLEAVVAAVASVRPCSPTLARKLVERFDKAGRLPICVDVAPDVAERAAAELRAAGATALVANTQP